MLGEVPAASVEQITECVNRARKAQAQWREVAPGQRFQLIREAYQAAEAEVPQLASLLSREMGKDIRRSTGEVRGTVYGGPYIAESAMEALRPQRTGRSTTEYKPLGIVAVISPWNYPLAMANNLIVPALMAGNSVIWKPSEETPLIAQAYVDLLNVYNRRNVLFYFYEYERTRQSQPGIQPRSWHHRPFGETCHR